MPSYAFASPLPLRTSPAPSISATRTLSLARPWVLRPRPPRACIPQPTPSFALADLPLIALSSAPASPGAYAIRTSAGALVYIGYTRNIAARLEFHVDAVGPSEAASVHIYAPADARKLSADSLEAVLEFWVRENGGVPEGNEAGREAWEGARDEREVRNEEAAVKVEAEKEREAVPYRARTTPKRVADGPSVFGEGGIGKVRSTAAAFRSERATSPPPPADGDFVSVDVDPLDPFSPARRLGGDEGGSGGGQIPEAEEGNESWIVPLFVMAGIMWAVGVVSSFPSGTPTPGL